MLNLKLPKILIIDDLQYDRLLYQEYLGEQNYEFIELDNGEKLIETLEFNEVDLILLDWQMPIVNGKETLRLISKNQKFRNTPVIIITGLEDLSVMEQSFDYGSVDFLNKPVNKIELESRVQNALRLSAANIAIFKQSQELNKLNEIISSQNKELEVLLKRKTESFQTDLNDLEVDRQQKIRINETQQLESVRIINALNEVKTKLVVLINELQEVLPENNLVWKLKYVTLELSKIKAKDDSLKSFKETYESIDQSFFNRLLKKNPNLTPLDIKHCAFIKLNLDNYEIARIFNVEQKSLQMSRYRLKKKLRLDEDQALRSYISKL